MIKNICRNISQSVPAQRFGQLNKVTLIGNVGKIATNASSDTKIANFSLAINESIKKKESNEYQKVTNWFKITAYQPQLVEFIEKHVTSGSKVYVEGKLKPYKYVDREGKEKSGTDIIISDLLVLDSGKKGNEETDPSQKEEKPFE